MRFVLDTNVVVSALLWNGPPRELLRAGFLGRIQLVTSTALVSELTDVAIKAEIWPKDRVVSVVGRSTGRSYVGVVSVVAPVPVARIAPDPDDDVVIGTALASKADVVVSGDQGLLGVSSYEGGKIVTVREALDLIQEESAEDVG